MIQKLRQYWEKITSRLPPHQVKTFAISGACVLLAGLVIFMYFNNQAAIGRISDMIRYIKKEKNIIGQLTAYAEQEKQLLQRVIQIPAKESPKKIEAEYLNRLKRLAESTGVMVDSFASESRPEKKFVIMTFNIKLLGDYPQLISFFNQLQQQYQFVYVKNYTMSKGGTQKISLQINLEIPAEKSS